LVVSGIQIDIGDIVLGLLTQPAVRIGSEKPPKGGNGIIGPVASVVAVGNLKQCIVAAGVGPKHFLVHIHSLVVASKCIVGVANTQEGIGVIRIEDSFRSWSIL